MNEQYLPLKILKYPLKGYGIVADETIEKNTLILSYTGVISTTYTINLSTNSLFHLGYL
jgi:hypothetical protein